MESHFKVQFILAAGKYFKATDKLKAIHAEKTLEEEKPMLLNMSFLHFLYKLISFYPA